MPGKIYPNEKEKLMQILSKDELKIIKKDYPFKNIRNAKIQELMGQGVSCHVLSQLPGTPSSSAIHRIGCNGPNYWPSIKNNARGDLLKIKAAIDAFNKEIKKY